MSDQQMFRRNIGEYLVACAEENQGVYFVHGSDDECYLSYADLYEKALQILGALQERGVARGSEIVFQLESSEPFVSTFWACIFGGYIPVPLAVGSNEDHRKKLLNVWNILNSPLLVCSQKGKKNLRKIEKESVEEETVASIKRHSISYDELDRHTGKGDVYDSAPDDLAFIQFSSGSTGTPKGVRVTHKNIMVNLTDAQYHNGYTKEDRFLSWAPLTHDLGILGFHICPILVGSTHILIDTNVFVRRPTLWMSKTHEHRGSILCSPNFGYKHFLKMFDLEKALEWDLSCIRILLNGAEPTSRVLAEEFIEALKPCGFNPLAMTPGYGMAESTLYTSITSSTSYFRSHLLHRQYLGVGDAVVFVESTEDPQCIEFVEVGTPYRSTEVRICDEKRRVLGEKTIGYIELRGENVTSGYYNNEEATASVLSSDAWLNSGDLGFLIDGQIVITGRAKDVIFVHGINYYPHDLEQHAEAVDGIDLNKVVACGVSNPKTQEEQILMFVRYQKSIESFMPIAENLRTQLLRTMDVAVDLVIPLRTQIPKTTSGKIQRYLLAERFQQGEFDDVIEEMHNLSCRGSEVHGHTLEAIDTFLSNLAYDLSGEEGLSKKIPLMEQGFQSSKLVQFHRRICDRFQREFPLSLVFDYPSIEDLSTELLSQLSFSGSSNRKIQRDASRGEDIAIVAMSCHFPGECHTPEEFWRLLLSNQSVVTANQGARFSSDYAVGALKNGAAFDNHFFDISPMEAEYMDPQQRMLLETSWHAFESGGYTFDDLKGSKTAVYVGINQKQSLGNRVVEPGPFSITGMASSTAVGRISYLFGLEGPNMAIDTACSSSLVAVHHAVECIRRGEAELALCGGVNFLQGNEEFEALSLMGALSKRGQCRTFDSDADGYVRGEGCGMILLKSLRQARLDGDTILAVIKGSAINHDGRSNGLTAPSGRSQKTLLLEALRISGVDPKDVQYVEAHGTGTPLGDPIEVQALAEVYRSERSALPLYLGSVKTNIGHLEAAAGIAGLMKAVLCLHHKMIPASLHCQRKNEHIAWSDCSLDVVQENMPWNTEQTSRYCGVSSFGFSGTNAHVILEEYADSDVKSSVQEVSTSKTSYVLPLSARSADALKECIRELYRFSEEQSFSLKDFCSAMAHGKNHYEYRHAISVASHQELSTALLHAEKKTDFVKSMDETTLAALFSGQGSQYVAMGRFLYERFSVFQDTFNHCNTIVQQESSYDLVSLVYGAEANEETLQQTAVTQPLLVAFEYALYKQWSAFGVEPRIVMGHSIGEYTAACVAGLFSIEDALRMAVFRGALLQSIETKGAMAAVFLEEAEVRQRLNSYGDALCIAAVNGPESTVVSGDESAVEAFCKECEFLGLKAKRLQVSHAFHSHHVDSILEQFENWMRGVSFKEPTLPFVSLLHGRECAFNEISSPRYWAKHLRSAVLFKKGAEYLLEKGYRNFLEIGPGTTLSAFMAASAMAMDVEVEAVPSLKKGDLDDRRLADALGQLYCLGVSLNWKQIYPPIRRGALSLPLYPFQRKHFSYPGEVAREEKVMMNTRIQASMNGTQSTRKPMNQERLPGLIEQVLGIVSEVTGREESSLNIQENLFQLGLDSLLIVQIRQVLQRRFSVVLEMNRFFSELETIEKIARYLDQTLEPETHQHDEIPSEISGVLEGEVVPTDLQSVFSQQLEAMNSLMSKQLEVLQSSLMGGREEVKSQRVIKPQITAVEKVEKVGERKVEKVGERSAHGPYKVLQTAKTKEYTAQQQQHLEEFSKRYRKMTASSRAQAQQYRSKYANSRNVIGFTPELKEFIYPLSVSRAEGARVWDLDGREYVDITMGFGVTLFGHNPSFVEQALQEELQRGAAVGPMTVHAGVVAEKICEMGGVERAAFFTTGTEAIMAGIRIGRMCSGRNKIVIFQDAYHGSFDGVLAGGGFDGEEPYSFPIAAGTPQSLVDDVVVLPYGKESSLEIIDRLGDEIGVVLVEPVASRKPSLQPAEFLKSLRRITEQHGSILLFDEIILGFRLLQGGAQEWFGVEADLVTYGKVVGGGLPIGVLAGKAAYMDAVDGGNWQYGDDSVPGKKTAFVAGTFNNHPLSMAAARAVMLHLEKEGPSIQRSLNEKTRKFCERLVQYFKEEQVPISVPYFGSLFRFEYPGNLELFNYHLIEAGVYVWEGKNCFLSTAHTDEDLEHIFQGVCHSVAELRRGGFLTDSDTPPSPGGRVQKSERQLSKSQKELLFVSQLSSDANRAYQEVVHLELSGRIDCSVLQEALKELFHRHEMLQTVKFDGSIRYIDSSCCPEIEEVDFTGRPDYVASTLLKEWMHHECLRSFNLKQGPFLRVAVIRRSENLNSLFIQVHHVIADGWSIGLLLEELASLYNTRMRGEGVHLQAAASYQSFLDFEKALEGEATHAQREYWNTCASYAKSLHLPVSSKKEGIDSFRGRRKRCILTSHRVEAIENFSRQHGVSPVMTLLSVYRLWLARLSGQNSFVVGVPVAAHPELASSCLIGQCTSMLPFVVKDDWSQAFSDYVVSVKSNLLEALSHQAALYTPIVSMPKIHALFNMDKSFNLDFNGTSVRFLESPISFVKADIFLNVLELDREYLVDLDYNSFKFSDELVDHWWSQFEKLLDAVLMSSQPLRDLKIQEPSKRVLPRVVEEYASYDFLQYVSRVAKESPDTVALVHGPKQVTYQELMRRVQRLVQAAKREDVRPGDCVGLLCDCPLKFIEATITALWCGVTLVPLSYVRGREEFSDVFESLSVHSVFTHNGLECLLPEQYQNRLISLDQVDKQDEATVLHPSYRWRGGDYVSCYYRQNERRGITVLPLDARTFSNQRSQAEDLLSEVSDQVSYVVSSGGSLSQFGVLSLTLLARGISVHIYSAKETLENVGFVARKLKSASIQTTILPVEFFQALNRLDASGTKALSRVILTTTGERISRNSVMLDREDAWYPIVFQARSVPLGFGVTTSGDLGYIEDIVDGSQPVVVDGNGNQQWKGVYGELAFLRNNDFSLLHRSGLRARVLCDDRIELRGPLPRADESEELQSQMHHIECLVNQNPGILTARVGLLKADVQEKELEICVCFIPLNKSTLDSTSLHAYLQKQLSRSLIPTRYALLDEMPETPIATLDMSLLESRCIDSIEFSQEDLPQSLTEKFLASIWEHVLNIKTPGREDNFFLLGGQSIHAARVIAKVQENYDVSCELIDVFRYPTICEFASFLDGGKHLEEIRSIPNASQYAVSRSQARLWLLEQLEPGLQAYHMPLVLSVHHTPDREALREAFFQVLRRHESLRTVFTEHEGVPYQQVREPDLEAYTFVSCQSDVLDSIIQSAMQKTFDLHQGPLCRMTLCHCHDTDASYVIVVMHHSISDGWSMKVFVHDFMELYRARRGSSTADLLPLKIQYRDYAAWESSQEVAEFVRDSQEYWQEKLHPLPMPLQLNLDFPRPQEKTYGGASLQFCLGQDRFSRLQQFSEKHASSRFMTLVTLLKVLFFVETGQTDIAFGTTISGRDRRELQDQIGFFVNNLVLRDSFSSNDTFIELHQQVRETILEAYEHQHYPYDRLVSDLDVPRDTSRNPLFDVMVVIDDRMEAYRMVEDHSFSVLERELPISQFDLTLYLTEETDDLRITLNYNTDLFMESTIERLADHLCTLLDQCLQQSDVTIHSLKESRQPGNQRKRASQHQERLWFVDAFEKDQLYDGSPVYYSMPLAVSLPVGIQATLLSQAFQELVQCHEVLRSRFELIDGVVFSSIDEAYIPSLELKELDDSDSSHSLYERAMEDVSKRLDFERDPLLRGVLYLSSTNESLLILIAHHIICDVHSLETLVEELQNRYEALLVGMRYQSSTEEMSFSRYQEREREMLARVESDAESLYWKTRLKGVLPALELPLDRPRPAIHTYTGGIVQHDLLDVIWKSLDKEAATLNITCETFLYAVFSTLLSRYAGQETIVCGVPHRLTGEGFESGVGPLTNLLVLKTEVESGKSFRRFAQELGEQLIQARMHGSFPFDELVRQLKPLNDMSRTALFDVMLRFRDSDTASHDHWRCHDVNIGWGKYDLVVLFDVREKRVCCTYNKDIFDETSMTQLLNHFESNLKHFLEYPDQGLRSGRLLSDRELEMASVSNSRHCTFPKQTLHEIFEGKAKESPYAIALAFEGETMTYQELLSSSEQIARNLVRLGIKGNPPIAVLMERSMSQIAVFLGILRAGAAYLPIDPAYPENRIRSLIEDSRTPIVVTDGSSEIEFAALDAKRIHLKELEVSCSHSVNLPSVSPDSIAYIIYTSGSTGKPKGVQVEHRNVVSLLCHQDSHFAFSSSDVWTMFHSPCFDFSVWEMYGALLYGGTLVIVPRETAQQPKMFAALLKESGVTVLNQTPGYFYELQKELLNNSELSNLRYVIFGGEALHPSLLSEFYTRYRNVDLINMFGITETTVHVTYKKIDERTIQDGASNIGKAIPSLDVYVLDEEDRPLPIGVVGELCVGGHGVTRGYLHRPELTAARFPRNPFNPSTTMYRSGDLVKQTHCGDFIYIGRKDTQVKVRGFRIETGEIEHFIQQHPKVNEAVVVDRKMHGETVLQACLVVKDAACIDTLELQGWLRDKLPDYMIPSYVITVDQLPLTSNGKVDRKFLASLDLSAGQEADFLAPRNDVESILSDIFCEVLQIAQVGVKDNFFALGGHSLKATQVVSRIHERLGVVVSLKDFFRFPVIEDLIREIEFNHTDSSSEELPVLPVPKADTYLSSFAQRRLWIYEQLHESSLAYSCYASFMVRGSFNVASLCKAFELLQERHESLRTVFVQQEGELRQRVLGAIQAKLEVHDFTEEHSQAEQEIEIRDHIRDMIAVPFDLEQGPLVRADVYLMKGSIPNAREAVLSFNMHHIISDGWSVAVFARDLVRLYESIQGRRRPDLKALSIQYKEFATWQHRYVQSEEGSRARAYWTTMFKDFDCSVTLPADFERKAQPRGEGDSLTFEFSPASIISLKSLQDSEELSQFMVFYSLVALLIYRYTSEEDITIGSPSAGRDLMAFEDQIGFFLNTLPLRSSINKEHTLLEYLQAVREVILDAYDHQRYPFDLIVENLQLERKQGEHPLFNVMVILQNNEEANLSCETFEASLYMEENSTSKFDINVMFHEDYSGVFEYDTERYKRETIERYVSDLVKLGEVALDFLHRPIAELCSEIQSQEAQMSDDEFLRQCLDVSDQF